MTDPFGDDGLPRLTVVAAPAGFGKTTLLAEHASCGVGEHRAHTHTKNIYLKLGVNNRREAVTRARELGL